MIGEYWKTRGRRTSLRYYREKLAYKAERFNKVKVFPDYFKDMIGDKKEITVADIGCGPFPKGNAWPGVKVTLKACDMLANEYLDVMKEVGITPVFPIEYGDMEKLSYPDDMFDIVYSVNAVDHTPDAIKAILEMERICKPGGWICLQQLARVGEQNEYRGLHRWNFDNDGERIILWDRKCIKMLDGFIAKRGRYSILAKKQKCQN